MDRVRRAIRRACILPVWKTALIAPACFALLVWVLIRPSPPILDHIAYQLSVYGLVISVTAGMRVKAFAKDRLGRSRVFNSPFGYLVRKDGDFRAWLGLCLALAWNGIYALTKMAFGVALGSHWLMLMSAYYLILALLRLILVRSVRTRPVSGVPERAQLLSEWHRYRLCGIVLLLMNQVLMVVVLTLVRQQGSFNYPGALIYLMAAYAFWAIINATVKLSRFHRRDDPLLSAAKAVSLTAAMVSMLSLETAMITRFGDDSMAFHARMTSIVGGVVCLVELSMAIYMIRRGGKMIAQIKQASD